MFSSGTLSNTRILSHVNNKHTNSARKFPGDFVNLKKIPGGKIILPVDLKEC